MEEIIWKSKPSLLLHWVRYVIYFVVAVSWLFLPVAFLRHPIYLNIQVLHLASIISFLIVIPAIISILHLVCTKYEISSERIFVYSGILNRRRDEVEIYRVKDYQVNAPLHIRVFGLGNITFSTSDRTTPEFTLFALSDSYEIADLLREKVELQRTKKGVREFD